MSGETKTKWAAGPYTVNRAPGHPTDAGILGPDGEWLGMCLKAQSDLFAAAPAMAAALEDAESVLSENGAVECFCSGDFVCSGCKALALIRAALALARGEQP